MRPVMVWGAVIVGVLLGLGATWIERQSGERPGLPPNPPPLESILFHTDIVIAPARGDVARIMHDLPRLFLVDRDGGRAVAVTYWSTGDGLLRLTGVLGLRPTLYTALIALYDGGEQDLLPISLDLSNPGAPPPVL